MALITTAALGGVPRVFAFTGAGSVSVCVSALCLCLAEAGAICRERWRLFGGSDGDHLQVDGGPLSPSAARCRSGAPH